MNSGRSLLVLGASGLLGRYVSLEAGRGDARQLHLAAWHGKIPRISKAKFHRLDLRDREGVVQFLGKLRPSEVLNCAGIVKSIYGGERDAASINSELPHLVAQTIAQWNGRLIHISTDCVFSGRRGYYAEEDRPDPVDLYGRGKLAGEVTEGPHLTIRTSFIGLEPAPAKGLLGWFLAQQGRLKGFRRAIWSGLTADVLAQVLTRLLARPEIVGLLHIGGEAISKADLLELAGDVFGKKDIVIERVDEPVCNRSLDASKMRALGIETPPIQEMLRELARRRKSLSAAGIVCT